MIRVRPLLRFGVIGLPLGLAACASADSLGIDTSDPNCVLLCALTRALTGEHPPPAPPQPARVPLPPAKAAAAEPSRPPVPVRQASLTRSVPPTSLRPSVAPAPVAPSPAPPRPTAQMLASPARPPAAAVPSPRPLPTLARPIPGSVAIVPPSWQDH
ncbi:hypothetical protein [Lichenifustis flavocetrariae]|uniref:Uncharacterized protein n=1 Tax=Lichenifustis flavocetrariae TaxID=2949735 RepID=A0AA42CRH1_9HYPH|nr:hypothetical protein [Lichenifustis flavocetrariae]MCW6512470.1 hypothetical protein [Lichenifustis flavocetrariae]